MASKIEFVQCVCDQLRDAGELTYKKMFGEYGIYLNGKYVAAVCDDQFFVKITNAGRQILKNPIEGPMYEGSRNAFLIEDFEDRELLVELLKATWNELPFRDNKKPKKKNKVIHVFN
jgi:TfoX/Sxy family transcriptional regulator of competence genes